MVGSHLEFEFWYTLGMVGGDYKVIASDFDGTLAGVDWQISSKVSNSIQQWISQGNHFSISTGKQYKHIQHECKRLNLTDPQIVRGGTEIVDPQTGKIIYSEYFKSKDLKKLIQILLESKYPFTAEKGSILYTLTGEPFAEVPDVTYKKISEMPYEDIAKIVIWTDSLEEKSIEDFVKNNINGKISSVEVVKSYSPYSKNWQITSKKATKYTAVFELSKLLHINPQQIVGIGDSYNDYPLLAACGYKVAMGNAPDELKHIADFIAPSYEDDGVSIVIDKLLQAQ